MSSFISLFNKPVRPFVFAFIATFLTTPVSSQQPNETPLSLQEALTGVAGGSMSTKTVAKTLAAVFDALDLDRDGIDQEDIAFFKMRAAAEQRGKILAMLARFDLNNDRTVTRSEMEQVVLAMHGNRFDNEKKQKRYVEQQIKTVAEMVSATPGEDLDIGLVFSLPEESLIQLSSYHSRFLNIALVLLREDSDQNGSIDEFEAIILANAAMAPPAEGLRLSNQKPSRPFTASSCVMQKVQDGTDVLLIGAYEGSAVPSVTVSGQGGETSTARIFIENGETPLFLVLTSYTPMIWRFSGATERVQQVVAAGRSQGDLGVYAGVYGIEKKHVSFVSANECVEYFSNPEDRDGVEARLSVTQHLGVEPAKSFGLYSLHELSLPSGRHIKAESASRVKIKKETIVHTPNTNKKFTPSPAINVLKLDNSTYETARSLLHYNPGGIVSLDVEEVFSGNNAENYFTLPSEAGLLQLLSAGKLEFIERGQYRILDKITLPAGLNGAHKVTFILPKGIPVPDGDPGHSCVLSMDAGGYLGRSNICR